MRMGMAIIPVLYSEVNILCIMFLLFVFTKMKSDNFTHRRQQLFSTVLLSNCVLFALDAVWIFVDSKVLSVGVPFNWALNILYYITSVFVGFFWFWYSENEQRSALVNSRKSLLLCALPVVFLSIMAVLSMDTGWLFYIDEANVYHRGPLYLLQIVCSYGYVAFTAGKAWYLSTRAASYTQKIEYRTLANFVIAPLIMGVIQVFVPNIATLCIGTTFGALYVFTTMQEQMISVDALTGLNNRGKLMRYLSERMARADGQTRLYLVMMDLDFFKSINDGYGHVEGDRALCITADALKGCGKALNHFFARYGGDEFAAVCELEQGEQIEAFCENVGSAMQAISGRCPYTLSLSIGWAQYSPEIKSDQEFIKLADAKLYQAKQQRKRRCDAR